MQSEPILIAGAGLSGATIARVLAEAGCAVTVHEPRDHVAGNCHTARDAQTGVLVHVHGPHIFHTDDEEVWAWMTRFGPMVDYAHKVRATVEGRVYPLPINLATLNQVFDAAMTPAEAEAFVAGLAEGEGEPVSFEDQALRMLGRRLYEMFFRSYTEKQWGRSPADLPAAILKRLPVRFTYDDRYFNHRHQAMPRHGYTALVEAMLDHPGITLRLGEALDRARSEAAVAAGGHVFWSGPLDGYFDHEAGALGYRTLTFRHEVVAGDYQGTAVMNWPGAEVPFTRITEHKHFAPWERHAFSIVTREYASEAGPGDVPYYPIRLVGEQQMLAAYVARAEATPGVSFVGRLGSYRYLDMDVTVREALDAARGYLEARATGAPVPTFFCKPL